MEDERDLEISDGRQLLRNLLHFARALRRLGLPLTAAQVALLEEAVGILGIGSRAAFKHAARAILAGRREHVAIFDLLFDAFFRAEAFAPQSRIELGSQLRRVVKREQQVALPAPGGPSGARRPEVEVDVLERHYAASDLERLRLKDFAELSDEERRTVRQLIAEGSLVLPPRRTRRQRQDRRGGQPDLAATLRRSLRRGGEPFELLRRVRREKDRPLVVLCDISGSMEAYARLFLPFAYTLKTATSRLEVFVFATRLTRITRELAGRDVDLALRSASSRIADWGGGTRIGEALKHFNYEWGRRLLGRGAWVVVLSDGWDRGDRPLLEREMARLRRSCQRLLWLNPLLGSAGYEPTAGGIRAVLPHVDDFLPVHDLRSLEQLAAILAGAGRPAQPAGRKAAAPPG